MTEEQCPVWEYLDAGEAMVKAAEWPKAIVLYQEGLKRYPDCPELHRALGFVQEQIGDRLGQQSSYQRAIDLEPGQPMWVYGTLGYLLIGQQQWLQAIEVYRRGLERYPEEATFYRQLGFAQEHLGEVAAEIASYCRAIDLEPQPLWVYETLVELLVQRVDVAGAIAVGQLGLEQYPEQVALQQRLAELQQEQQTSENGRASGLSRRS